MSVGVTLSELDRRVRSKLSESGAEFFTSQNVLDWVNEAQDVICSEAPFTVVSQWEMPAVPSCPSYLLPTEMVSPVMTEMREATGRVYRLTMIDEDLLDQQRSWTIGVSGRPRLCAYRMTDEGAAVDIWPAPTTSPGVELVLLVAGHMRPVQLSALTDRSDIPPFVTQAVVDYCVWQAKLKDEENQESELSRAKFEESLNRLVERRLLIQYDQFPAVREYRQVGGYRWPYT